VYETLLQAMLRLAGRKAPRRLSSGRIPMPIRRRGHTVAARLAAT
jgi:hypothetical protein